MRSSADAGQAATTRHGQVTSPGWIVLPLACAGEFIVVLDLSVVNVALPSIQRALALSASDLPWVVNSYALVFAGFLLVGGRLADLYGRRRVFLTGLALFTVASLVGGLAGSGAWLIAARAVQGLGAAVLTPATVTLLTTYFPEGPRRTKALAMWAAVASAGGTAGNLAGGVLTEDLSWRSTLLVNVPIGVGLLAMGVRWLVGDRVGNRSRGIDLPGAVLATAGLASLTFGISRVETHGGGAPVTLLSVALGLVALVAFVLMEARIADAPLIPPRLFAVRAISIGNVVMLLAGACFMPMWYFLSLFMQNVLGYRALSAGLGFLPHTVIAIVIGARLAPWLMRYLSGRTLIIAGALVAAAGFWWQSRVNPTGDYLSAMFGPAILIATGSGLLNTPITATVNSGIAKADAGAASGLMNTTKQFGGALGLAALAALASTHTGAVDGLLGGYRATFVGMAVILVAVALAALALPPTRHGRGDRAEISA